MTDERPNQGGSYVRNPDGTVTRQEFTRQIGDPDHDAAPAPPTEPEPKPPRPKKAKE